MSCLLITYSILVFIIFCLTVGSGVLLLYRKDAVQNEVDDAMIYMTQHYYQGPEIIRQAADHLQETFRCCGNSGCGDYFDLRLDTPRSCDIACDGCGERIYRALRIGFMITGIVFCFVVASQVLGMILSLYLCCWSRGYAGRVLQYGDMRVVERGPTLGPGPPPSKLLAPNSTGYANPLAPTGGADYSRAREEGRVEGREGGELGPGPPPPYAFFAPKHASYQNR